MSDAAVSNLYVALQERAWYEFCYPLALHMLLYGEDLFDEDNKTRYMAFLYDEDGPLV